MKINKEKIWKTKQKRKLVKIDTVTSSPPWTFLAACTPGLPSRTTAFLLLYFHHFRRDSLAHIIPDDRETKPLPCVYAKIRKRTHLLHFFLIPNFFNLTEIVPLRTDVTYRVQSPESRAQREPIITDYHHSFSALVSPADKNFPSRKFFIRSVSPTVFSQRVKLEPKKPDALMLSWATVEQSRATPAKPTRYLKALKQKIWWTQRRPPNEIK